MLLLDAVLFCFNLDVQHLQILEELGTLRLGQVESCAWESMGMRFSRMVWMKSR